jgi:hypothetical protein
MSSDDVQKVNTGVSPSKYKGFVAGVFSGIAKLSGKSIIMDERMELT